MVHSQKKVTFKHFQQSPNILSIIKKKLMTKTINQNVKHHKTISITRWETIKGNSRYWYTSQFSLKRNIWIIIIIAIIIISYLHFCISTNLSIVLLERYIRLAFTSWRSGFSWSSWGHQLISVSEIAKHKHLLTAV